MVTMHNAKRISRLAAVGGVAGALALGAFGLAVSAHENTSPLADSSTQTPGATATQTPGATATSTATPGSPSVSGGGGGATNGGTTGGGTVGGGTAPGGTAPGGTVPGAGDYVPGSGR